MGLHSQVKGKSSAFTPSTGSQARSLFATRPFVPPETEATEVETNASVQRQGDRSTPPSLDFVNIPLFSPTSTPASSNLSSAIQRQELAKLNQEEDVPIQAKLTVGQPNDPYEQEADRVADQVMSMPDAAVQQAESSISSGDSQTIQCEEDKELESAIDTGKTVTDSTSFLKDLVGAVGELGDKTVLKDLGAVGELGDKTVSTGINLAGAILNFGSNKAAGQSTGEAIAGATGSFAASELVEYGSKGGAAIDSGINAINSIAKAAGAPEAVTNLTQIISDGTASSFVGAGLSNAGRAIFNGVTGDTEALNKQFNGMAAGKSGAALQGYELATQVAAQSIATEDVEAAFLKVGSQGKDSPVAKIGGWLGEKAYQLLHGDETSKP